MKCATCKRAISSETAKGVFCSERCRMVDLGRWLNEEYRVPGEPDTSGGGAEGVPDPSTER